MGRRAAPRLLPLKKKMLQQGTLDARVHPGGKAVSCDCKVSNPATTPLCERKRIRRGRLTAKMYLNLESVLPPHTLPRIHKREMMCNIDVVTTQCLVTWLCTAARAGQDTCRLGGCCARAPH